MPEDPELHAILNAARAMLARGAIEPDDDLHWPALATVGAGPDGRPAPDARTVVLRRCSPDARALEVHTDALAGKVAQLRANPAVCLLAHHRAARTQLRLWGTAAVHHDDALALQRWSALRPDQQRAYADDPSRFAVLAIAVERLDWLLLDPSGHRRAAFDWTGGSVSASWLAA
jgi:pyridoxine/pyridoxamine 5'-phosphate oxidase